MQLTILYKPGVVTPSIEPLATLTTAPSYAVLGAQTSLRNSIGAYTITPGQNKYLKIKCQGTYFFEAFSRGWQNSVWSRLSISGYSDANHYNAIKKEGHNGLKEYISRTEDAFYLYSSISSITIALHDYMFSGFGELSIVSELPSDAEEIVFNS